MAKNSISEMFKIPKRDPDAPSAPVERKPRPSVSTMGKEAEIALLNARVVELEKSAVVELRIDTLIRNPERRRIRSPEKYEQLRQLIVAQGQTDPIKVFRRPDNKVEVFEGHNRCDILESEQKTTVKAIFLDGFDLLQAEKLAVTSNSVQSESSTYYVYASAKRLVGLGVEVDEVCELLAIKLPTYYQINHLDLFPQSALELLRDTGLKLGANRVLMLGKQIESGEITEDQIKYVITELASGAADSIDVLIEDAREKYPSDAKGSSNDRETPSPRAAKPLASELMYEGKRIGKMAIKPNGARTITLSNHAPAELVEQIETLIKNYKS